MHLSLRLALLIPTAALVGCAVTPTAPTGTTPASSWANWQIQAGTAITSPPNTYPSFLGAIQIQGTVASGVFSPVTTTGTNTALQFGGTFNSSTGAVAMTTTGYGFNYIQPTAPYTVLPVGVIGGCVYPAGYTGPECLAIASSPSVGVEIAPLNGTYTGYLLNSSSPNPESVSLTLMQSSSPNASGQFPLTATLVYLGSLATYPMTGTVAGEGISLSYQSPAASGPTLVLSAATNPAATEITVLSVSSSLTGPPTNTTGTLTLQ